MATPMEKRTCTSVRLAQQRRNWEETLKLRLRDAALAAMRKGVYGVFRVDRVYCGPDLWTVTGDRHAADAAAELFRKGGLREVTVGVTATEGTDPNTWTASGLIR